jgi:hypothetical protein
MAITVSAAAQQAGGDWCLPSDDEVRGLIAARNAPRPGQGIVIRILGPECERMVSGGTGAGAGFDSTTVFEIGSITKVFTALLLADMANKREVSLDDPAAKTFTAASPFTPCRAEFQRVGVDASGSCLQTHRAADCERNAETALMTHSPATRATGKKRSMPFWFVRIHGSTPESSPVTTATRAATRKDDNSRRRRLAAIAVTMKLIATIVVDHPA